MQILYFDNGMNEIIFFIFCLFFAFSLVWIKFLPWLVIMVNAAVVIDQILTDGRRMILSSFLISGIFFLNFFYVYFFKWNFWGHAVNEKNGLYYIFAYFGSVFVVFLNEKFFLDENWDKDIKQNIKEAYLEKVKNEVAQHVKNFTFGTLRKKTENFQKMKNIEENGKIEKNELEENFLGFGKNLNFKKIDTINDDKTTQKNEDKWVFEDDDIKIKKSKNGIMVLEEKDMVLMSSERNGRGQKNSKKKWNFVRENLKKIKEVGTQEKNRFIEEVKPNAEEWNFEN